LAWCGGFVVGLPVAAYKAKKRAALERLVLGKHDVGRGKTVRVERARVVPQPQGALMYYGHVHNRVAEIRKERSLIIDPGARTFDGLVTQGMQLVEKKSHSVNRGMFDVLQAIASGISKATGILDGLIRAVAIDSMKLHMGSTDC